MKTSHKLTNERFNCPFLKIRTGSWLRIENLARTSKWTSTCNDLVWRPTSIGFFLRNLENLP